MLSPRARSSSFGSINLKATLASLISPRARPLARDLKGDASSEHVVGELDAMQDVYADTQKRVSEGDRSSTETKQFVVRLQVSVWLATHPYMHRADGVGA